MNSDNPFDKPATSGTLSADEQAEYDRLAAEERDEATEYEIEQDRNRDVPAGLHQGDADAEANYPVRNAAVKWDDASNGGDTSREAKATYDTPWGRRELSANEVVDFGHQGVVVTRVDAEPETSLDAERDELSKIDLDFKTQH